MQHIIIGAGPAGVVAAETLRRKSPDCSIKLIGDEPEPPYSRMALPYHLADDISEAGTYLRKAEDYFDNNRIEVVRARVESVNTDAKNLSLDNGGSESYDRLLIATGSAPRKPPISGVDLPGVHNCWTLADARAIIERARAGSKVVLMGAGFIGCIILEALNARKVDLTVIEMEDRMVPRMMNSESGGLIKSWCEGKGVNVLTSTSVKSIESPAKNSAGGGFFGFFKRKPKQPESGSPLKVNLSNGKTLEADLVICATGVAPNMAFVSNVLKTDHGILVDQTLATSADGVFAAGDVAQGLDFSTGGYSVQAIQPTAVEHGRLAASNMLDGHESLHRGSVNMNILDTMGLISGSFGAWQGVGGGDSTELRDNGRYRYLNLQFQDDVLVGANSLGLTQNIGVLRGLIQTKLPLGKWKSRLMNDPTRISEAYISVTQSI